MSEAEESNPEAGTHALVRYDEMCRAIAEAYRVDEVKDIRDKAMAFALYARQANNHDAELQAIQIRVRAERRAGELSKELPRGAGNQHASPRGADGRHSEPAIAEKTLTGADLQNEYLEGVIRDIQRLEDRHNTCEWVERGVRGMVKDALATARRTVAQHLTNPPRDQGIRQVK